MAKGTKKRAALYLRVSTGEQTTDNQLRELRAVAKRSGWDVVEVYRDHGISGAKGRDQRPEFNRLCEDATRRQFDVVMAWSVDRLGRSLQHLVNFMAELHALKVDLYLHQQGVDTTTPAGEALFGMSSVFAQFERRMIQERVNAGLARAKAQGTKSGKAIGRPRLEDDEGRQAQVRKIKRLRAKGLGIIKIARQVGVGVGTVQRIVA